MSCHCRATGVFRTKRLLSMFLARYLQLLSAIRPLDILPADLETPEAEKPAPTKTEPVIDPAIPATPQDPTRPQDLEVVKDPVAPQDPAIPQDIIYQILDHLVFVDSNSRLSLRSCSLVSKSWVTPCRGHLFRTLSFSLKDTFRWIQTFPIPDQSPAHYIRYLRLSLQGHYYVPEEFFRRIQGFTNMKGIAMSVDGDQGQSWWMPSSVALPHSVTSLTLDSNSITVLQIRNIMVRLPNLNDLSLSGSLRGHRSKKIGKILTGKFGGRLELHKLGRGSYADVVNMLVDAPTGLHFTEVDIHSGRESLLSTVRLIEACRKSLVKVTYTVNSGKSCPFRLSCEDADIVCQTRRSRPSRTTLRF